MCSSNSFLSAIWWQFLALSLQSFDLFPDISQLSPPPPPPPPPTPPLPPHHPFQLLEYQMDKVRGRFDIDKGQQFFIVIIRTHTFEIREKYICNERFHREEGLSGADFLEVEAFSTEKYFCKINCHVLSSLV